MKDIAQSHNVVWNPDPPRQSVLVFYSAVSLCSNIQHLTSINVLSEFLDPEATPEIDLIRLRKLCRCGG